MLQLPNPEQTCSYPSVESAYEFCRQVTAEYSKTFYLGTLLMPKEKRKAIWAIYVWCRRTDQLVDGPEAEFTTLDTLDQWEKTLESIFAGNPVESPDLALVDTLKRFPLEIQPFRDLIAGQRMDLKRDRYQTFDELYLYCYRVAGTVGLMSNAVLGLEPEWGVSPWQKNQKNHIPTEEAVALGIANQLTNILRDVGEDADRGRIYLPLEDLERFNYREEDLFNGVINENWRQLMQFEIQRARGFYAQAERGIRDLSRESRWPVWTALMLYQGILDVIERNQYDVFNRRAYVPKVEKFLYLPVAWLRSQAL
ncbi:15-cis-phytoene synthase CrtB [Dactylococcopsis salina]|uniref:15-cis-phytoene synthase n=1 Tax=Dactylococcopsis salina (strain PCC 8305) TaxID=13035 RepID=K9YUG2_DACS8|nr:phytoene synthase [Dactylococcopsis salina]AFZ50147.1 phytoene/squalene synthetase [Dactylococcopsis salina PCC 8305]